MNFLKRKTLALFLSFMLLISAAAGCVNSNTTNSNKSSEEAFSILKSSLSGDNVINIVKELTSEKYDGRLAGSRGNKLAEDYIADYFKNIGLKSPEGIKHFRQEYSQASIVLNDIPTVELVDKNNNSLKSFEFLKDFQVNPNPYTKINGDTSAPIYLIRDFDELNITNRDLEGKFLLIPQSMLLDSDMSSAVRDKISLIKDLKGVVFERDLNSRNLEVRHFTNSVYAPKDAYFNDNGPVLITCESESFKEISEASKSGLSLRSSLNYSYREVKASNVLGLIPGTDKKLRDEYIIISGHFDHLGNNKNGTYNPGALDNSSGTASLIGIAKAFMDNKINTKRSILFVAFNGEEEGLYGSKYFSLNPPCDLKKAVMINMDMVGHKNQNPLTLYSTEDSKLIDDLKDYANTLGINVVTEKGDRSDHAPIEARGAEAVTLIEMEMAEYHSYRDTIDKLDSSDIKGVMDLIVYYISKKAF